MRNPAELDWRRDRSKVSGLDLLDGISADIRQRFDGGDEYARHQILTDLRDAAVYQPDHVISLIRSAIDRPIKLDASETETRYRLGQHYVLESLPGLLMQSISAQPDDAVSFVEPCGSSMVIAVAKPMNRIFTRCRTNGFTPYRIGLIREHKDEITALQLIYSRAFKQRPTPAQLRELAQALEGPPLSVPKERLWEAYRRLERSRVRGSMTSMLTDLVSLVRFALQRQNELHPFKQDVDARFATWIDGQEQNGKRFTDEQRLWLEAIRDHIAASLTNLEELGG